MSTPIEMSKISPLTEKAINEAIKETKAGNYRLGVEELKDGKTEYYARYVGRSGSDVKTEIIKRGLNDLTDKKTKKPLYTYFRFVYAKNEYEAYSNECNDYHHFYSTLDNKIHPATPEASKIKCPIDGCEYSAKPKSK
jgi:hypothetical protein